MAPTSKIQHVDSWRWAETASSSALWVYYTGLNGTDKYKTNADTTYVVVEATYDRHGEFDGWDVSEGGYGDIIEWADRNDKDNDGYITLVQVVKADDGTAELVYILKYIPTTVYDVLFYGNHDAFTWSGAEQYEEGSDYTGTITAAEGYDISNVTVTQGAEYVTLTKVDSNTWNVVISDIAADVSIQVDVAQEVEMRTLRLEGDLADADVYIASGILTADRTGMENFVAYAEYDVPVDTELQIRDSNDITVTGIVMVGNNVGTAANGMIQVNLLESATLSSVTETVVSIEDVDGNVLATGTRAPKSDKVVVTVPKEHNDGNYFLYNGTYYAYDTEVTLSETTGASTIVVTPGYIKATVGNWEGYYLAGTALDVDAQAGSTSFQYTIGTGDDAVVKYAAYSDGIPAADVYDDIVIVKGYVKVNVTPDIDEANVITEIVVDNDGYVLADAGSVSMTIRTDEVGNHTYKLTYQDAVGGTEYNATPDEYTTSDVDTLELEVTITFTAGAIDRDFTLKMA